MRFIKFFENFSTRYFDDINDMNSLSKAYRKLAFEHHPDKATDKDDLTKRTRIMQDINSQKEEAENRIRKAETSATNTGSDKTSDNTKTQEEPKAKQQQEEPKAKQQQEEPKAKQQQEEPKQQQKQKPKEPRQKKTKLTPEEIQKIKTKAAASYKETLAKAKATKEKRDIKAKEEFDAKIKESPRNYDSAKFGYKRALTQNDTDYQTALRKANAIYNKLVKDL